MAERARSVAMLAALLVLVSVRVVAASDVVVCYLDAKAMAATDDGDGYWMLREGGEAEAYGAARSFGGPHESGYEISARPAALEPTPSSLGYWTATADGGVFTHGDAPFRGSAVDMPLLAPVVDLASTPDGGGYWLLAADGGVFTFGSSPFAGSAAGTSSVPFVAMAPTASGHGYWLARGDGAVFPFGDANTDLGPASTIRNLRAPIVDVAAADGGGIWLAAADGGVFAFGAPFHGSAADVPHNEPIARIVAAPNDGGYWLMSTDGGVFTFGDARFFGATANPPENPRCDG